jgi:hypothetical protein
MDQTAPEPVPQPVTPTFPTQLPPIPQAINAAVGQAVVSAPNLPLQPPPVNPAAGSVQKEQLTASTLPEKERVPLVELSETEKIPEEVEGYLEKLEQAGEIKIPEAIKKDEQVILENARPTKVIDTVRLPLTQQGATVAAKKKVTESARWLYEWCKRLIKILGERAKYRDESQT